LQIGARFGELLGGTMEQTNMWIGPLNNLAIKFKHKPQDAVRRRMLGPEIERVIFDICHTQFLPTP
jgi:hypothetical protein